MSTATTTDTGQTTSRRTTTTSSTTTTATQTERSAANRLRATMAAVRLAFTWLVVRETLAPEQRTTAARAIQADGSRSTLSVAQDARRFWNTRGQTSWPAFSMTWKPRLPAAGRLAPRV